MKTILTKGYDKERSAELMREFKSSSLLRAALTNGLQMKIDAERDSMESKSSFNTGAWAIKQANSLAYVRGLKDLIAFLK